MNSGEQAHDGGCTCGAIRYRVTGQPIFVHCCHCTWCQRETGSAFALNALYEADRVVVTRGAPEVVPTPSASGRGQKITRCPTCHVALWSNYSGAGDAIRFLRVGSLDDSGAMPPDIHIFTSTRLPWVVIPEGAVAVPEYYSPREQWPAEALARWKAARDKANP